MVSKLEKEVRMFAKGRLRGLSTRQSLAIIEMDKKKKRRK